MIDGRVAYLASVLVVDRPHLGVVQEHGLGPVQLGDARGMLLRPAAAEVAPVRMVFQRKEIVLLK